MNGLDCSWQLALAAYSGIQLLLVSEQVGVVTVLLGYACQKRLRAAECAINFITCDSCSLPCCSSTGQAAFICDHISCQWVVTDLMTLSLSMELGWEE